MINKLDAVLENIELAKQSSPFHEEIKLIAVSKIVSEIEIKELYAQSQISFGENKVQDLKQKSENLKDLSIDWHFIGRLQTNKINQLLSLNPSLIHSCSSLELAIEIDKRATNKPNILLQINSAHEKSKAGVFPQDAIEIYKNIKSCCKNINLCGVMSIGAHSDNEKDIQKSFEITRDIYENVKLYGAIWCSMGMSSDYQIAIKCGSNMIRVGSALF